MLQPLRARLLFVAALLMGFAAVVNAAIAVPHLRGDMVEIHVRPTLLGAIDPEFRIVSAIGSYEANGTLAAAALWSSAIATYLAVLPSPSAAVGIPTLSHAPLLILLLALAACGVWFAMKR